MIENKPALLEFDIDGRQNFGVDEHTLRYIRKDVTEDGESENIEPTEASE